MSKFIVTKDYSKLLDKIISNSKNDLEIYRELAKYKKVPGKVVKDVPVVTSNTPSIHTLKSRCGRDIMQSEEIVYNLNTVLPANLSTYDYLDIGCGNCIKTVFIGELLGLPLSSIYGADIDEWFSYSGEGRTSNINFIKIEQNGLLSGLESDKFMVVTAQYMLHHVQALDLILKEINRIMKVGGYFVITEHDAPTNIDKMMCDIEHGLHAIINENDEEFFEKYYAKYYDWIDWDIIMGKYGFEYVKAGYIMEHTFDIPPTRKYYGIYRKVGAV